jgi:glycosyltransferase involved in cell wall biosynthesis
METKEAQIPKPLESAKMPGREAKANLTLNSLTIVIPALNEEEAIGNTIARVLAARDRIKEAAGLDDVEVIVVSDGSTDRTAEIAQSFTEVKVIVFEKNRGYGAAIKEGFRQGNGTLVGFLDADGTCDPEYFAEMSRVAVEDSADIVLGSRMGPDSKMPKIRRLGNRIYAFLLGLLCGQHVTDTASGMRVIRRRALKDLYPLPNGLHFTPSMSARAMLNGLRVIEIPMRYEERVGRSKLSVLKDGGRFLQAIFAGVLCYRPERLLLMGFSTCLLLILLLAAYPAEFYYEHRRLEEWMIYRFVACYLTGSFGLLLLLATALVNRMAHLSSRRMERSSFWPAIVAALFRGVPLAVLAVVLVIAAFGFLWPGIRAYATSGHADPLHWSRLLAGAFALFSALQTVVFALLMKVVSIWQEQRAEQLGRTAEDASARGAR